MKVIDIAHAIAPEAELKIVGIRPGEKLHEQMIGVEDSHFTFEYPEYYKILPQINDWGNDMNRIKQGERVAEGFLYASDTNSKWMSGSDLLAWVAANSSVIGKI